MSLQQKSIGLIVVCLVVFLGLFTDHQVQGRSLQKDALNLQMQDVKFNELFRRKKRDSLTEFQEEGDDEFMDVYNTDESDSLTSSNEEEEAPITTTTEQSQSTSNEDEDEEIDDENIDNYSESEFNDEFLQSSDEEKQEDTSAEYDWDAIFDDSDN